MGLLPKSCMMLWSRLLAFSFGKQHTCNVVLSNIWGKGFCVIHSCKRKFTEFLCKMHSFEFIVSNLAENDSGISQLQVKNVRQISKVLKIYWSQEMPSQVVDNLNFMIVRNKKSKVEIREHTGLFFI